jgi:hypothetical protein
LPKECALTVSKKKGGITLREISDTEETPSGQVGAAKTLKMIKWSSIKALFMPVPTGTDTNREEVVHKNQIYIEIVKVGTLILESEQAFALRSLIAAALPSEGHDLLIYQDYCYDDNPLSSYDDARATLYKVKVLRSSCAMKQKDKGDGGGNTGDIDNEDKKKGKLAHEAAVHRTLILSEDEQLPEVCTLQAQSRGLLIRDGAGSNVQDLVVKRIGWGEITRAFGLKNPGEGDGDDTFTFDFSIKTGMSVSSNYTVSVDGDQVLELRSACRKKRGQDDSTRLDYDEQTDVHAEFLAEYDALVALYRPGWNALFGNWFWNKLVGKQVDRSMPEKPVVAKHEKKAFDVDYWEEEEFEGCGVIQKRTPYAVKVVRFDTKTGGTKNTTFNLECLIEGRKEKLKIVRTMQEISHLYTELPMKDLEHEKFDGKDFPSVTAKDSEIKRSQIGNWLITATTLTRDHQVSEMFVAAYMLFLGLSEAWKPEVEEESQDTKKLAKQKSFASVKEKKPASEGCMAPNHFPAAKQRKKTKAKILKLDDTQEKMIAELNKAHAKWDKYMEDEFDPNASPNKLNQEPTAKLKSHRKKIVALFKLMAQNKQDLLAHHEDKCAHSSVMHHVEKETLKLRDKSACYICLEVFNADTFVRKLPCGDQFHSECIGKYMMIESGADHSDGAKRCPICQFNLTEYHEKTEHDLSKKLEEEQKMAFVSYQKQVDERETLKRKMEEKKIRLREEAVAKIEAAKAEMEAEAAAKESGQPEGELTGEGEMADGGCTTDDEGSTANGEDVDQETNNDDTGKALAEIGEGIKAGGTKENETSAEDGKSEEEDKQGEEKKKEGVEENNAETAEGEKKKATEGEEKKDEPEPAIEGKESTKEEAPGAGNEDAAMQTKKEGAKEEKGVAEMEVTEKKGVEETGATEEKGAEKKKGVEEEKGEEKKKAVEEEKGAEKKKGVEEEKGAEKKKGVEKGAEKKKGMKEEKGVENEKVVEEEKVVEDPLTPLTKIREISVTKVESAGDTAGVNHCTVCEVSSLNADIEEDDEHPGTYYCDVCWDKHLDAEEQSFDDKVEAVCTGCDEKKAVTPDPDNPTKMYCTTCWAGWGA